MLESAGSDAASARSSDCSFGSSSGWMEGDCLGCGDEVESPQQATLYAILGVSIMAPAEAIRSAYRRLARLWHPDRHRGDEDAKRRFQEVQGAYEVLSDRERRHEYDLNLLELLDVEEYLSRYQGLILKCQGLSMSSRQDSSGDSFSGESQCESLPKPRGWVQLLKAS